MILNPNHRKRISRVFAVVAVVIALSMVFAFFPAIF